MKKIVLTIITLGCLALFAPISYACFCVTSDVPGALDQASAVFLGEVIDVIQPRTSDETAPLPDRFFTIKFKVERSWKGVAFGSGEISVLSAQGRYGCFAYPPMAKGERYLIYADPVPGGKHWSIVTICNRTTVVRIGFNLSLAKPDAIDPYSDMKELDAITKRAFKMN